MEKYLLTGATGHLGLTIAKRLVQLGKTVRALVLPDDSLTKHLPPEVEIIFGDVTNAESLEPFFLSDPQDTLYVIHAAGIVSIASKYDQRVYDVNVNGTVNIIDQCKKNPNVKHLVYVSSVHAIPEKPKGTQISEINYFSPEDVVGLYSKTKSEATALVLNACKNGIKASVVHPSGIIGPNDYAIGHTTQMFVDYITGKLHAGVLGGYDFVDVRDVAEGIISCCKKGKSGECYILSNRYISIPEMFGMIGNCIRKQNVKIYLPTRLVKLVAPLAELYYKKRHCKPLFTTYSLYTLSSNACFTHEKATRELAFTNRSTKKTIKDTVDWVRRTLC